MQAMSPAASRRPSRLQPSKGDRRQQALSDAAERLLATGRFTSASVAELAAEAGISRAAFYFYFASKQDLLGAVIAAALAGFERRLTGQLDAGSGVPGGGPAALVAGTVRAATDLWWEHRVVLMASVELGADLPEVYDRNMATIADVGRVTVSLLGAASADGSSSGSDTVHRTVRALILMTERNFYDLARRSASRVEYDELCDLLTTIWLRALGLAEG